MEKFKFYKSVLLGTLLVVCICSCGRTTADYVIADQMQTTETESESVAEEDTMQTVLDEEELLLYVYICGEVNSPGVYTLPEGSRVCDVFSMAGGFTDNAATSYWNQARLLKDGEMIYVPTIEEAKEREVDEESQAEVSNKDNATEKININTASKTQLMTIPGIGESKASAIVAYREAHGAFSSIEEVKNVEGIKDGVFKKMKEYIVIN